MSFHAHYYKNDFEYVIIEHIMSVYYDRKELKTLLNNKKSIEKILGRTIYSKTLKNFKEIFIMIGTYTGRISNAFIASQMKISIRQVKRIISDLKKIDFFEEYNVSKYLARTHEGKLYYRTQRIMARKGYGFRGLKTNQQPKYQDTNLNPVLYAMMRCEGQFKDIEVIGLVSTTVEEMYDPLPMTVPRAKILIEKVWCLQ